MNEPNGMNIIIVAKPHATPRALDLKCWRMRAKLAGLALLCILCFGGAGFAAAACAPNSSSTSSALATGADCASDSKSSSPSSSVTSCTYEPVSNWRVRSSAVWMPSAECVSKVR